ncbi:MAG: PKD domain-containing protein, partial [Bacteroidia bacterium]
LAFTFPGVGNYVVSFTVRDSLASISQTFTKPITVLNWAQCFSNPTLEIIGRDTVCLFSSNENPDTLRARFTGGSGVFSGSWRYTSNGMTISHSGSEFVRRYTQPGQYHYIFQGQDVFGGPILRDTLIVAVTDQGCDSIFSEIFVIPDTQCIDFPVSFYNIVKNDAPVRWGQSYVATWDFGDGNTSLSHPFWHQYQQAGNYNVQLCVDDTLRNQRHCSSKQVHISPICNLTGEILGPDTLCYSQLGTNGFFELKLNNSLQYFPAYYSWFLDSIPVNSIRSNYERISFSSPGSYQVRCVYRQNLQLDSTIFTKTVYVLPDSLCNWEDDICILGPDTVCMSGFSTFCLHALVKDGGNYIFNWVAPAGISAYGPTLCISLPFEYVLIATDPMTGITKVITKKVVLSNRGSCPSIPPSLNVNVDTQCIQRTVRVSDGIGLDEGYKRYWDMGDGTTYQDVGNIDHQYTQPGTYQINLTFIDTVTADTSHFVDSVHITARCWPQVILSHFTNPDTFCVGRQLRLTVQSNASSNSYFSVSWDMDDGTIYNFGTGSHFGQSHRYQSPGTYVVKLRVVDRLHQDTAFISDTITVDYSCWHSITADSVHVTPQAPCPNQSANFRGYFSGGSPVSSSIRYWTFGDGGSAAGDNVQHVYAQPGNYTAQYCVIDTFFKDTTCISRQVQVLGICSDTISGYLFYDKNQDTIYNTGDTPLAGLPVRINPGGNTIFADTAGYYEMALAPGVYTTEAIPNSNFINQSPTAGAYIDSLSGSFIRLIRNFGYDTLNSFTDPGVLVSCGFSRPGFTSVFRVFYQNHGTLPASGTVSLQYDPKYLYLPSGSGITHDPINHTVSWNYNNLLPGSISFQRNLLFSLPIAAQLGDTVRSVAMITSTGQDSDLTNNLSDCEQIVTGSYDPNDKSVNQPSLIRGDEWLTYTIRFQNTGTDTAFNVRIEDQIDVDLDLGSFQMLGASHAYRLMIDSSRNAIWSFPNILLPDSNTNEPLSHGMLLYRIKPKPGIQQGDRIENTAAIYFDFNAPIITNTVTNTVDMTISLTDARIPGLKVFPNPTSGLLEISASERMLTLVQVFDIHGRRVLWKENAGVNRFSIDLHSQPAGAYVISITDDNRRTVYRRVLKQ